MIKSYLSVFLMGCVCLLTVHCGLPDPSSDSNSPANATDEADIRNRRDSGHRSATDGGSPHSGGLIRVLFDTAHKQVSGQADWIIDSHGATPQPANPTSETSWNGGISAWGYGLYSSGRYSISQLPTGSNLSWGDGSAGDLQNVDVFISDEPEVMFSPSEISALNSFAQAKGGIFMVSDHAGAIRGAGCVEAWRVINSFLQQGVATSFGIKLDGNMVGSGGLTGNATTSSLATTIGHGPFGSATGFVYHSGSSVSLVAGNAVAQMVITSTAGGMMAASQLPSGGRLVVVGDSSPMEDGTCQCNARLHNGWGDQSNAAWVLNATAWLAHDGI